MPSCHLSALAGRRCCSWLHVELPLHWGRHGSLQSMWCSTCTRLLPGIYTSLLPGICTCLLPGICTCLLPGILTPLIPGLLLGA